MADIEVVIKIPDDLYKGICSDAGIMIYGGMRSGKTLLATLLREIRKGTPLDDVKVETQRRADDPWNMTVGSASQGLKDAIEILDNINETNKESEG